MKHRSLLCAAALITATAPALAADGAWYLSPNVGYLFTDHHRATNDDVQYGLGLGKELSPAWNMELNLNQSHPDKSPGAGHIDLTSYSLDWLRVFNRDSRTAPYLTFGAGDLHSNLKPGTHDDLMAQAGIGLFWRLTSHFSLRPEIKARWSDEHDDPVDLIAQLGFQLSFGGASAPPPAPVPPPPPPVAQPVPAPAPAPTAPPPPQDSDQDGVLDNADQCPGTPHGVAVDAAGCPKKGSITLEGVNFEVNSAQLTADSSPVLNRVAEELRKYPRLEVELQGHTDSSGSDKYNLSLSQRRADSVRDYLIKQGVAANQLTAKGYGESQPIADNKTAAGRAQNRRVVMSVLKNPGDVEVKGNAQP